MQSVSLRQVATQRQELKQLQELEPEVLDRIIYFHVARVKSKIPQAIVDDLICEAANAYEEARHKYDSTRGTFQKFVNTVVSNTLINYALSEMRQTYRMTRVDDFDFTVDERPFWYGEDEDKNIEEEEEGRKDLLHNAIKNLPKEEQEIVRMIYFKGMTQEEVGKKLNVTKQAICQRNRTILNKLFMRLNIPFRT